MASRAGAAGTLPGQPRALEQAPPANEDPQQQLLHRGGQNGEQGVRSAKARAAEVATIAEAILGLRFPVELLITVMRLHSPHQPPPLRS